MTFSLAIVQPLVSMVLPIPLEDAWAVVRDWGEVPWIPHVDQRPVTAKLTSGGSPTSVGASRLVKIGDQQWHERLVALDDETHTMKWRLISHPDTVNPFTASFVNYMSSIKLHGVTEGNQTFLVWRGEFFTEHDHAEGMKEIMERWYRTSGAGLQEYLLQPSSQQAPQPPQGQAPISGQPQYAHASYPGTAVHPGPPADPSTTATGYSGSPVVQGSPFQNYVHDSYHSNGSTS